MVLRETGDCHESTIEKSWDVCVECSAVRRVAGGILHVILITLKRFVSENMYMLLPLFTKQCLPQYKWYCFWLEMELNIWTTCVCLCRKSHHLECDFKYRDIDVSSLFGHLERTEQEQTIGLLVLNTLALEISVLPRVGGTSCIRRTFCTERYGIIESVRSLFKRPNRMIKCGSATGGRKGRFECSLS